MIYEILYIIPSKYSDTEIEGVTKSVQQALEKHGAKIEKTDVVGKIKLAYPINKETHGTYVLTYVELDGENVTKIDNDLKLMDEVLRHILVKREEGIPTDAFMLAPYEAPINAEGKRVHQKPKNTAPKRVKAPQGEKLSMEELDKKLDSILDDTKLGDV